MRPIIAIFKLFLFFCISLILVPLQMLVLSIHKGQGAYIIPHFWQKCVCGIFRLKVSVIGTPLRKQQVIYVSNHLSYLDIPVIGSIIPASFVAKKDVSSWPVFGFLSRLQQTAFIDRSRNAAAKETSALDIMLNERKSLILFPEGTSTDGTEVVPFKSSLFSLALKKDVNNPPIQPFAIKIISVDRHPPATQELRDIYAWHRNMTTELPQHLWRFSLSRGARIELEFFPAIHTDENSDRKILAGNCYQTIARAIVPVSDLAA